MRSGFRQNLLNPSLAFALAFAFAACNDSGDAVTTDCVSSVDRGQVLAKADELVRRRLASLTSSAESLQKNLADLRTQRNEVEISEARRALLAAWIDYRELAPYSLLVDPTTSLGEHVGPFPTDTSNVLKAVANGTFDPTSTPSFDRGFPAIEYLLFGSDSTAALDLLDRDPNRVAVMVAYAEAVQKRVAAVQQNWQSTESATFKSQVGTDAGSGISRLVNSINKHFEDMRRDELGLPFGASLGFPSPRVVQARYSGESRLLLLRGIAASEEVFGAPNDGSTLAGYLSGLNNDDGAALAQDIYGQYQTMLATGRQIQSPLSAAVVEERDKVQALYTAMSRQVVFLKTDLPAVTCVAITYVDNPSDSD